MLNPAKYYTPEPWTTVLLDALGETCPRGVLDPAVGEGALLLAATRRFSNIPLLGIDIDERAVKQAKASLPKGIFSIGDALCPRSLRKTAVWQKRECVDTVVANPPFADSMRSKLVNTQAFGRKIKCGVAVAHVVSAVEHFRPNSMVAILPQSVLHSHRDENALDLLGLHYAIEKVAEIGRVGFKGASAATEVVRLTKENAIDRELELPSLTTSPEGTIQVSLVRGGLPVHRAHFGKQNDEIPYLHTTDLCKGGKNRLVKPIGHGVIEGLSICIPRVGFPKPKHLNVVEFESPVQLSDCVIAMCFRTRTDADKVCRLLREDFSSFYGCWAGTGAAYTTLVKVRDYLGGLGIIVSTEGQGNSG